MDNPWLHNMWPYVWMCYQGYVACPTLGLQTTFQHFVEWKERLCLRGFNIGWLWITVIKKNEIRFHFNIFYFDFRILKNKFPLKQAKCALFAMSLWVSDMVFTNWNVIWHWNASWCVWNISCMIYLSLIMHIILILFLLLTPSNKT